jgi:hypothetical protein
VLITHPLGRKMSDHPWPRHSPDLTIPSSTSSETLGDGNNSVAGSLSAESFREGPPADATESGHRT